MVAFWMARRRRYRLRVRGSECIVDSQKVEFSILERAEDKVEDQVRFAAFVNKKLALKSCAECDLQVTEDRVNSFEFAHLDASDKVKCVSKICTNYQSLETARPLLDAEMSKCRLICSNCHKLETRQRNVHLQCC